MAGAHPPLRGRAGMDDEPHPVLAAVVTEDELLESHVRFVLRHVGSHISIGDERGTGNAGRTKFRSRIALHCRQIVGSVQYLYGSAIEFAR